MQRSQGKQWKEAEEKRNWWKTEVVIIASPAKAGKQQAGGI